MADNLIERGFDGFADAASVQRMALFDAGSGLINIADNTRAIYGVTIFQSRIVCITGMLTNATSGTPNTFTIRGPRGTFTQTVTLPSGLAPADPFIIAVREEPANFFDEGDFVEVRSNGEASAGQILPNIKMMAYQEIV